MTVGQCAKRKCSRCGKAPGHATWDVCADHNRKRVLCWKCDKALNRLVLRWMRDPKWREKCERYEARHE